MESAITAPVSGHIKRVLVHEGALFLCFARAVFECVSRRLDQPGRSCSRDCSLKAHVPKLVCTVEECRIHHVVLPLSNAGYDQVPMIDDRLSSSYHVATSPF